MKRWQKAVLVACAFALPLVSCAERSLVLMVVTLAPGSAPLSGTLRVTAKNGKNDQITTFDDQSVTTDANSSPHLGVYLPSDMSGTVDLTGDLIQRNCIVASGEATAPGVSAGATVKDVSLVLTTVSCIPVGGGGGSGEAGAGAGGAGGSAGAGGRSGVGGHGAAGGMVGSGGSIGTGGSGSGGRAAAGGSANGGSPGSGGIGTGAGGLTMGAGGSAAGGSGTIGSGGSGNVKGSGGMTAAGGSGNATGMGGSPVCVCKANEICDPNTGACTCRQTAAEACASAGAECGNVQDTCGDSVNCGICPTLEACSGGICVSRCVTGTGGIVLLQSDDDEEAAAAPICPLD